jgi:heme exporter protein A
MVASTIYSAPVQIALDDVSHRFGLRWVLVHVHAAFPAGSATLLTGNNGAGKTTLLRIAASRLRPTRGKVQAGVDHRRAVGFVSHMPHLYEDLTIGENLEVCRRILGRPLAAWQRALEEAGLLAHAERPVRQCSAGMRKRLSVARLLLKEPSLWLLDEPFGQLDAEGVAWMEAIVARVLAAGHTVVLSTHDVARGAALCSRRMRLQGGRLVDG